MPIALLLLFVAALLTQQPAFLRAQAPPPGTAAAASLDYEYFKTKVQPIFLAKREGHSRCASCHMHGTPMRLQELAPGAATWTEEQSKRNFQIVAARVTPRSLSQSKLLIHPLVTELAARSTIREGNTGTPSSTRSGRCSRIGCAGGKPPRRSGELTGGCGGEE